MISVRSQWSVSLSHSQAFGGGVANIAGQQQDLQFSYGWSPSRKWHFSAGGGPARFTQPAFGTSLTGVGSASVSYLYGGSALSAHYSRGFDLGGFAGGQISQNLSINWQAPPPRGHKWRYTVTGSYQLAQSGIATPGQSVLYSAGGGYMASASFSYPVTRALWFSTNYGYFFQNITGVPGTQGQFNFQRHLVSMGFHYSFEPQGAPGGGMPRATGY